jgi:hypothetical protein
MFKRGGSSFQAQGTGITSPYDTPRKRYANGPTYEDIYSQIRETTKDPRGDFSYAAQGFSELGNPYKESGEAKTIGEMLYAGAAGVRGSREKASDLERSGELSILESQGGRLAAKQAHDFKMKQIAAAAKTDMLKKEPRNRQKARNRETLFKISQDPQNTSSEFIGIYLNELADGYTDGDLATGAANVINPKLYTKDDEGNWGYDTADLSVDRVWFDPITSQWLVFQDTDGDGMANGVPIYSSINVEDSITFFNQQPKGAVSSEGEAGNAAGTIKEEPKGDVDIKTGKLKKKQTTSYEDMVKNTVQISDIVDKVTDPETWAGTIGGDTRGYNVNQNIAQKADGGRIGYAEGDVAATELDMLNNWWKNMQANDWKE